MVGITMGAITWSLVDEGIGNLMINAWIYKILDTSGVWLYWKRGQRGD
jgi:hypothetical protein